jgi:hypothetical protein
MSAITPGVCPYPVGPKSMNAQVRWLMSNSEVRRESILMMGFGGRWVAWLLLVRKW